jgi:ubiquinone/menaquinone biosynthesis C-methylase UbiE
VIAFGPIAPFYDELMSNVPYRMWVSYYLLLLSQQGVKPKRILDVCCGTGTMCELMTREGFDMTGFDISAPMIDRARAKAAVLGFPIRYEVADAAQVDLGETFEAAYSFFDSLNYITDPEKLAKAIKRVGKHLEPGSSFVFDLNTAFAFEAKLFDQKNLSSKAKVRYEWKGDYDPATRLIAVHMKFWHQGREYEETHNQRAHDDDEIREMLDAAGFADIQVFHSYTLNPPRRKSDRVHYTAIKQ